MASSTPKLRRCTPDRGHGDRGDRLQAAGHGLAPARVRASRGRAQARQGIPCRGAVARASSFTSYPLGYMCTDEASTNLDLPLVRAASRRADLSKPMPYKYAFVRANAPQYLRVPSRAEQEKSEFKLDEHLAWFSEHRAEVPNGAARRQRSAARRTAASAVPGLKPPAVSASRPRLSENELLGGAAADDPIPFWLKGRPTDPQHFGLRRAGELVFADRVRAQDGPLARRRVRHGERRPEAALCRQRSTCA